MNKLIETEYKKHKGRHFTITLRLSILTNNYNIELVMKTF